MMTAPNVPIWSISHDRWDEFMNLSRRKAAEGILRTPDPLVADLQRALRSVLNSYMGARDAGWTYEATIDRIREAFAIHETPPPSPFDVYSQRNNSPIIGWRPHPFSAWVYMAMTSSALPPPPKCDICGQLQTAACHVAASEKQA